MTICNAGRARHLRHGRFSVGGDAPALEALPHQPPSRTHTHSRHPKVLCKVLISYRQRTADQAFVELYRCPVEVYVPAAAGKGNGKARVKAYRLCAAPWEEDPQPGEAAA